VGVANTVGGEGLGRVKARKLVQTLSRVGIGGLGFWQVRWRLLQKRGTAGWSLGITELVQALLEFGFALSLLA
jgi:hypothetical protein